MRNRLSTLLLFAALLPFSSQAAKAPPRTPPFSAAPEVRAFIVEMHEQHAFDIAELTRDFSRIHSNAVVLRAIRPAAELARAEALYGVPAEIVTAIIGVETEYGRNMGMFGVLEALATLAFDYPPRAAFFRSELEHYLLLARENGDAPLSLKGSYAGAMGIPQFMPSSQRSYAVDFDGDARIDLAHSSADAIGSVAHFLQLHGWEAGAPVAVPASPAGDPAALLSADYKPRLTLRELVQQGLGASAETEQFGDRPAALIDLVAPAQPTEYWIAFDNFYVITRYNHSTFYAMAVFQLAQALRAERSRTTE